MVLMTKAGAVLQLDAAALYTRRETAIYGVPEERKIAAVLLSNDWRKYAAMISNPPVLPSGFTGWPEELLYSGREFAGYTCKRGFFNAAEEEYRLDRYFDTDRAEEFSEIPLRLKLRAAEDLCGIITALHRAGYIAGDFDPAYFGFNAENGRVCLNDATHIQVISDGVTFFRGSYAEDYIPAEIQKALTEGAPETTLFTPRSDDFALAVIIFRLLMHGTHPGACKEFNLMPDKPADERAEREFASFPEYIRRLFHAAFAFGDPSSRPGSEEWYYALCRYRRALRVSADAACMEYYDWTAGSPFASQYSAEIKETGNRRKTKAETAKAKKRAVKIAAYILAGVLLLAALVVGIYFIGKAGINIPEQISKLLG